ncbi:MAG: PD40 domain-containing protein, partial [Acidobacteriia bacterium]|nr:PD40 domain-containing protein [Terriglobia bacterium]
MGPVVNSQEFDSWPAISPNGLSLYFGSGRPGGIPPAPGADRQDIWVSRRASIDAPWGEPRNLGPNINSEFRDNSPMLSRDGHWLIFGSARVAGRCSANSQNDFYVSYRENAEDDFAWEPAVNFGCELSAAGTNTGPTFFHDDDKGITTVYFSSTRAGGYDIYMSTRRFHGAFGPPALVPELSSQLVDYAPSVRADGLEMFLFWNGLSATFGDLSVATRETTSQPWTAPKNLGPMINSASDNGAPALSCDGTTLYFGSSRPGGVGAYDLYFATRKKLEEPAPVLLPLSRDASRQGAILHAGTSQAASSSNPAVTGELLEIYLTGLVDGSAVAPQITIGDRVAEVLFFGKAPGFAGLNQVNVRVPAISPGPAVPVRLTYLGRLSNEVTIGVR